MVAKIICLEGITGAGKTTQALKIADLLKAKGNKVSLINEKNYEPFKQTVIAWHNEGANQNFSYQDILKFAKARAETHRKHFKPLLELSDYLLFDRCLYTSGIYQANDDFSSEEIIKINLNEGAIKPEKGLVLLCSSQTALERTNERRKVNLYNLPSLNETLGEIKKRKNLYFQLIQKHPELFLIDSEQRESKLFDEIKEVLNL